MPLEVLIAVISAGVALVSAAFTIWGQSRSKRLESELRRQEANEERDRRAASAVSRFREPLADAVFELQSRIYNIAVQGLVSAYYANGSEEQKNYVVDNTAFLIAQFFGWSEIFRTEIQFFDLGEQTQIHKMSALLHAVDSVWLRDDLHPSLCIFRGDQRAIGEEMTIIGNEGKTCLGYAAFTTAVNNKKFLSSLRTDVQQFATNPDLAVPRLIHIQHHLIDILDFLDPDCIRFPENQRSKI